RVVRVKARYAAGLVDRREALAVESEHAELVAQEAATATRLQADRAALAVLAGRSPTAQDDAWEALLAPAPLPAPPDLASLAQPTDLLARRPDVAKADALLRASLGNVVLAERAHLPRLTLNVFGGILAPFGSLGDSSAKRYSAGPELQWEWLSFGRKKAREEAARAGGDQNWHAFEQTVLTALKESEDSLHAWTSSQVRMQQAVNAEALSSRSS
ncbi:TolC family protein, partial [Stenotrophomonas maltophilia]